MESMGLQDRELVQQQLNESRRRFQTLMQRLLMKVGWDGGGRGGQGAVGGGRAPRILTRSPVPAVQPAL